MSGTFDRVVLALAALVVLPAIVAGGGFVVAIALAVALVVGAYSGRYGLRIVEKRHVGAKQAGRRDARDRLRGGPGDDGNSGGES